MKRDFDPRVFSDVPDPFAEVVAASTPAPQRPKALAPSRARVGLERGFAFAAALAYDAFWLLVLKAHGGGRARATIVLAFLIPLVASLAALSAAIRRGAMGLGEPVAAVVRSTCGAFVLFVVATLLLAPADVRHGAFWPDTLGCVGVSALFAIGPLAFVLLAFRGAFASASTWRTLALGVACGALATVMMSIVCPVGGQFHVLVGHGTVMLVSGAIGGLVGRQLAKA